MKPLLLGGSLASAILATAAPVPILNPSGEINTGVDRTAINDPGVPGWNGTGGQVINDRTDYGNGGWRLSLEDSDEIYQMTSHVIQPGDAFSLRFDAAMFAGNLPGGGGTFSATATLVGPGLLNGDFNEDTSTIDSRSFDNTPSWTNLAGGENVEATKLSLPASDGSRNAVVSSGGSKQFGIDPGHTLTPGDAFRVTFEWRDASNWADTSDRITVTLFTTSNDEIDGPRTYSESLESGLSTVNASYQTEALLFPDFSSATSGKVFVSCSGPDTAFSPIHYARLDNFKLEHGTYANAAPPRVITAELYIDDNGARTPVATRTYDFKTPTIGVWDHYHLAVPAGDLDAHAGNTIGVRFRSNDAAVSNFQSVDNIRLDAWPATAPDGSFTTDWNTTPDQVWAGPGLWANRLHDWQVSSNRVAVTDASQERRTLHRTGTSIRGNGGNFSLSVRTGHQGGTDSGNARSGFLLGAGPNLDWRAALLVQDSLGRDFGLFLGLRTDGAVAIEDYSTGAVTTLASGSNAAGFTENSRLELDANYVPATGTHTLTISAYDPSDTLLSTATTSVPSDRVLGSFGLLSHKGSGSARFWFDDFTGTGTALQPEPERHLAIIGAMHTLSRGTLRLTAQLPPLDLATAGPVVLETWNGAAWQQAATAIIDNTDNMSSYTATFTVPGWNDAVETGYRVRINIDGTPYTWGGTIRPDPVDQQSITIASTTCQRIADLRISNAGVDWSPVDIWHPHTLAFTHIAKHQPDVLLATGDQIYEGQPTFADNTSSFNRHHDYLYKWFLWVLQARDLARDIPTIAIPDDHDIYQGNLWGEGGISTGDQNSGGYVRPADWVKMVERTQTSNLPDPDPYNPVQPAPTVAQGIKVYFTGMTYGRLGFAILEDRKFKTGRTNPPADPDNQYLLGDRQKDFLANWNTDWNGQDLKLVVSQSPFGNLHTHAASGYNFSLNDRDTHGWPLHRRQEAWQLLRSSRMFQLAGDQHLATVAHHGINAPRDAGFSFTSPAIANFFPRCWDPVHNSGGRTNTISPYLGDFFFDGNGTLPSGGPNLTATDPAHVGILAAGNPLEYHNRTRGINPANLHDRGAGYGIIHVDKTTRDITFECWPLHADPDFPQTGSQFPDWPVTISQTDNDGRIPTGFLPSIDTHWRKNPVIAVYDESSGDLVYAMRIRGNLFRPPVYDNGTTYRVEITYDDGPAGETLAGQTASPAGAPAIHAFTALQPSIITGNTSTLRWNVESPATLTVDQGVGDVLTATVDGIGFVEVSPVTDTTYTLTLNGGQTAATTVRVFPGRATWNATHFTPTELANPTISGDDADPDGDGFTNRQEFQFQTDPRNGNSRPVLSGGIINDAGTMKVVFTTPVPLDSDFQSPGVESSATLAGWTALPANSFTETARNDSPAEGTTRLTIELTTPVPTHDPAHFFRAFWELR